MHSRRSTAYFDNAVLVAYGDVDFSYASANGATFDSATMASLSYNVGFYGANLKCAALPATHAPPPRHTRCAPRSHRLKRCAAPALTCPLRARLSRRSFADFDDVTIYAYSDIDFGYIDAYYAQFNRAELDAYGGIFASYSNFECATRPLPPPFGRAPSRLLRAAGRPLALMCPLCARTARSFADFDSASLDAYWGGVSFFGDGLYASRFEQADIVAAYGSIDFANSNVECGARPGHTPHRTRHATPRHSAPHARSAFG